ncbi:MAG: hypothetical protein JWN70_6482 [Planctomycetaceae bacterium]|nr:hypothetical protein [Planctomycetaceae bacterium]
MFLAERLTSILNTLLNEICEIRKVVREESSEWRSFLSLIVRDWGTVGRVIADLVETDELDLDLHFNTVDRHGVHRTGSSLIGDSPNIQRDKRVIPLTSFDVHCLARTFGEPHRSFRGEDSSVETQRLFDNVFNTYCKAMTKSINRHVRR